MPASPDDVDELFSDTFTISRTLSYNSPFIVLTEGPLASIAITWKYASFLFHSFFATLVGGGGGGGISAVFLRVNRKKMLKIFSEFRRLM